MAFDAGHRKVVLSGGLFDNNTVDTLGDTWVWGKKKGL
jgi:hypothetical protein